MEHDERLTEKQKQVITDELRKLKEPSFVEIERIFKNQGIPYSGECSLNSHINDHVYFWTELTAELDKLKRLVQEQKFKLKGSSSNADK